MMSVLRFFKRLASSVLMLVGGFALLLTLLPTVKASYIIRDGGGTIQTIFAFTCLTTQICPGHVQIDSSGNEKALPANPATIGSATVEVCVTPTITSGSAYSGGNEVGGLIAFNAVVNGGLTGRLQSVRLTSLSTQTAEFDVTFFSSQPSASTWTDKTNPNIQPADKGFVQPPIKLTNNASLLGTATVYGADNINRAVQLASTTLYAVITTPGTPNFTSSSDLKLCASLLKD